MVQVLVFFFKTIFKNKHYGITDLTKLNVCYLHLFYFSRAEVHLNQFFHAFITLKPKAQ